MLVMEKNVLTVSSKHLHQLLIRAALFLDIGRHRQSHSLVESEAVHINQGRHGDSILLSANYCAMIRKKGEADRDYHNQKPCAISK